ncbi:hypothetical protein [Streptomyces gilvus]|uniref:hypothetical protein n=1 Tax=Streptomyces gilvus TaxID=2920937 RepID=UPI001F0FDA7A|nr:hypothetical protein [Streptomyces sp. CME 23]MCH5671511.1 hypothetical protein [Streptomyces sp. CME 23]
MTVSSKWRAAFVATAASAALAASPLVGAQSAQAQPYPPPPPGVTLSDSTVEPGDSITFQGTGFVGSQPVEVEADLFSRKVVLGHFTADPDGTVEGTVTIPERTEPGEHLFSLTAEEEDLTACTHLYVEGADHTPPPGDHDHDNDPPNGGHEHDPSNGGPGRHPSNAGSGHGPSSAGSGHGPSNASAEHDPSASGSGQEESYNHKPHLANTGDDYSPYLMGGAAALVLLGGWALMAARRLKRR